MAEDWTQVQRFLFIVPGGIGDVVMLSPVMRTLKRQNGRTWITLLTSPAGAQAAPLLPWADDVLSHTALGLSEMGILRNARQEIGLIEAIRSCHVEAAIIFTNCRQSPYTLAYACYLAGLSRRVGQSKEFGGAVLSQWVKPLPDEAHQVDRNLHLLEAVGLAPAGHHLELRVPAGARASVDFLLEKGGVADHDPFILLAPLEEDNGAYDTGQYARLAATLAVKTGLAIVATTTADGTPEARWVWVGQGEEVSLVGWTTVPQLAALTRRASLTVTNDLDIVQLADALRRPVLMLRSGRPGEEQRRPRQSPVRWVNMPRPQDIAVLSVQVAEAAQLLLAQAERIKAAQRPNKSLACAKGERLSGGGK